MRDSKKKNIRLALETLASTHRIVVRQMEQTIDLLNLVSAVDEVFHTDSDIRGPLAKLNTPIVHRDTLSIEWEGKSCFLGNTLLFRFFDRISRSRNQYVANVDLLEDVWGVERKDATIRGVAKRLRDRLVENGMEDLAQSIDGSESGYYGLILN